MREVIKKTADGITQVIEQSVTEYAGSFSLPVSAANKAYEETCDPKTSGSKPSWYGGLRSAQEAIDIVASGWAKGSDKLSGMREALAGNVPAAKSIRRRPVWAEDGHTLDIDKAWAGEWDTAWQGARREIGAGCTIVELVGSFGGNCHQSAEELFWNGATALVLTDILEDAGYQVRLTAQSTVRDYGGESLMAVRVVCKDAGEMLRPDAIAAVMCHAGTYRTLGFRQIMHAEWNCGYGLGSWTQPEEVKDQLVAAGEWHEGAIHLPGSYSRAAALSTIREVLSSIESGGKQDAR